MSIRTFPQTFVVGVGHMRRLGRTALGLGTWLAEIDNPVLEPWHVDREVRNLADPWDAGVEDAVRPVGQEGVDSHQH